MSMKPAKVQFNGGELSPWLEGRTDIAKYDTTAKLCRNFIPMAEGCLKRRGGTRFVAETADDVDVVLTINTVPADATVVIDGVERRTIAVERGDSVAFEVTCMGYYPYKGNAVVVDNAEITVALTAIGETCSLEIIPEPGDATVMIEGVERRIYNAPKNSEVYYKVSRDEYDTKTGTVILSEDTVLHVTLNETTNTGMYGDWGEPQYFVACSQVGNWENLNKNFCIRFDNGYLLIWFSSKLTVPGDDYNLQFYYTHRDGYNSMCIGKDKKYHIAQLHNDYDALRYRDLDGSLICGVDKDLMCVTFGWPADENGKYAGFYGLYDGEVYGNIIRVKYNGKIVWKLKRRE